MDSPHPSTDTGILLLVCSQCGPTVGPQPVTQFRKRSKQGSGYRSICHTCRNHGRRARYAAQDLAYTYCKHCKTPCKQSICDPCFALCVPCGLCGRTMRQYLRNGALREACSPCRRYPGIHAKKGRAKCRACGAKFSPNARKHSICEACAALRGSCTLCGSPMPKYNVHGGERKVCSEACKFRHYCQTPEVVQKATLAHYGNGPRQQTLTRRIRISRPYQQWRAAVLLRDKSRCQRCGIKPDKPEVHHILSFRDHPDLRLTIDNGITLCPPCHGIVDKNRGRFVKVEVTQHTIVGHRLRPVPTSLQLKLAL